MEKNKLVNDTLDQLPQGVTIQDESGRLIYANQKAAQMVGLNSPEQMLSPTTTPIAEQFLILDESGQILPTSKLPSRLALKTHKLHSTILRFKHPKSKLELWSWVQAAPIFHDDGSLKGVINTFYDITDIKQSEQSLKILNQISSRLLNSFDYEEGLSIFTSLVVPTIADWCAIDTVNDDGELVQIAISHVDKSKISIANELRTLYPPVGRTGPIWHVLETGKAEIYPMITPQQLAESAVDKKQLDLLSQLQLRSVIIAPLAVRDKILGVITYAFSDSGRNFSDRDMTSIDAITGRAALLLDNMLLFNTATSLLQRQDKTLAELIESENTLKLALEAGNMGVWDYNVVTDTVTWSDRVATFYGHPTHEHSHTLAKFYDHIDPLDRARIRQKFTRALSNSSSIEDEFRINLPNQPVHWIHKIGEILHDGQGNPIRVITIDTDITEHKLVEDKIRLSENKFKSIFDASLDTILIVDDRLRVTDVNLSGCEFLRLPHTKIIGKNLIDLLFADQKKEFTAAWENIQQLSISRGNFDINFPDGRHYILEYHANAHFLPGQTLFIMRDITKRVEEENRRRHLLSIASHELRTPITSIKVFVDLLRSQFKNIKAPAIHDYLEKIDEKTNSLTQLIGDILDLARIDEGELEFSLEMFNFDKFLEQLLFELQLTRPTHQIISTGKINRDIVADKNRLSQVIINLIKNAIKYSPDGDKVLVKSKIQAGRLILTVQDFGIGIRQKELPKIFNLYYRVESAKKIYGLGVGLYISSQIVKAMGGRISVSSKLNRGSTFTVNLPLTPKVTQKV